MGKAMKTIIWKRYYDEAAQSRRMKRFYLFYLLPATLSIVLMAIFKGLWDASGLLILLGVFGLMLFGWIWMIGFNLRMNSTVVEDNGYLYCNRNKVAKNEITAFSTYQSSVYFSYSGSHGGMSSSSMEMGYVTFLLRDKSEVSFAWPAIEQEQLDSLREALDQVLPGKWKTIETLRQL
jgi:hypothetical protein